jgi:hypothetical protein
MLVRIDRLRTSDYQAFFSELLVRYGLLFLVVLICGMRPVARAEGPPVVPLWEKGAPGFENRKDEKENRNIQKSGEYSVMNVHNPYLTVFLPPKDKATERLW